MAATRPLQRLYRLKPVSSFGPMALKAVRQAMIEAGHCRNYINDNVNRIKRMFKWAVAEQLAPPQVYQGLQAVDGLKRGRSKARETEPVKPVPEDYVNAVQHFVSCQVWAMIQLQRLTGMRSGEVVVIRACDINLAGDVWLYQPSSHKTEHHGRERVIQLGPRAQRVIEPFLARSLDAHLFSPAEADVARRSEMRARRKTPVQPSQRNRRRAGARRQPRDHYTPDTYRRAIVRACDKADTAARQARNLPPDDDRIIPRWHPHQLRHNFATRMRMQFGLEVTRVLLGHSSIGVTEHYAEIDRGVAADIMGKVG